MNIIDVNMDDILDYESDESYGIDEPVYNGNTYNKLTPEQEMAREKGGETANARHYVKIDSSTFGFVDSVTEQIPNGFYRPTYDNYNQKAYVEKLNIVMPKLYRLPNDVFETIMGDIEYFWKDETKKKYEVFGNVYKRNILLYSVPGNGKSSLINMLCQELMEKHNGLIITINNLQDLVAFPKCIERIRHIEPERKIIVILEDFDGLTNQDKSAESNLLQILDGNAQYDNIICIATTNYIEELKPSFTNRPSRFNLIYEYKKPNAEVRKYYFYNKLKDSGFNMENSNLLEQIDRLTEHSEGYTFDYCKELAELIYVMDYSEEDAFKRIDMAIKMKGKYKITEENGSSSIGFGLSGTNTDNQVYVKPKK